MQNAFSINQIVDNIGELNNGNTMELDSIVSDADVVKLKSGNYLKNYDEKELCFGKDESEEVCANAITVKKIDDEALEGKRLNIPTFHKCLNCETHFSTKYQYQRHQCNFNSENYVGISSQTPRMQSVFAINQIVDDIGELNNGNTMEMDSIVSDADVVKLKSDNYLKNYDEKELCFGKDESEEVCANAITVKKIDDEALEGKRLNIPTFHKCLNCETHFSTKYQYQRHQCNFNSENYVGISSQTPRMQSVFAINQIVDDIGELNNGNTMELDSIVSDADVVKLKSDNYLKNYDEKELCFGKDESEEVWANAITVKKIDDEALEGKRLNIPTFHKCLNCETHFPTKYQYQRHQCNFNSENYVLKSSQASTDNNMDHSSNGQYKCSVCPKVFANKEHLGSHQKCHIINQCEFCSKNVIGENRLRIHKENHCKKAENVNKFYRSDIVVWKCKKCQEIFSCLQNGKNHQHFCQQGKPTSDKDIEQTSTEILLQCEFCNRTFIDKSFLLTHQRNHTTAKNFECVNCDKAFDSYPVAVSHWIKKCSEFSNIFYLPKLTYCEYCDKTFKNHALLYNHKIKKRHYTQKLFVSNLEFGDQVTEDSSKENMNQLIEDILETLQVPKNIDNQNHGDIAEHFIKEEPADEDVHQQSLLKIPYCDKKPKYQKKSPKSKKCLITTEEGFKWQCEKCIQVFDVIDNLETHKQNQHESVFACSTCPEVFQSARALLTHTRLHKSLKPYVCDICGRSFSQTSHLGQHMRFHQGIKPFACPHEGCEARYTIRSDLKDHICKVHTRERPFKCNVCNKRFLTGSVYYQHRLIHTNDRRYICDACGKKFFRADALNNHKRIHTNERPYPCNICEKYFRQKNDRNKHVRTQHANVHIEHN